MSDYPKTIPDVRAALLAVSPPSAAADAIYAAQAKASPVVAFVDALNALAPLASELDEANAELLAGCAYLVSTNGWHGLGAAAVDALLAATARLAAFE